MELNGIDVSVYQGDISWTTVGKDKAIKFAMIKATYGKNGIDPKFTSNMTGVSATDISAGAYHYFSAQTPSEAVTEANHFINTIKPYKISYPLALSLINEDLIPIGKQKLTENVIAFLQVISNSGYKPILFTNLGFINNYLDMNKLENTDIWLAEWGPKPTYTKNVTIWQYKNTGKVYGIDTDVDMNISYKDYAENNTNSNQMLNTNNINNYSKNNSNNSREITPDSSAKTIQNNENLFIDTNSYQSINSTQTCNNTDFANGFATCENSSQTSVPQTNTNQQNNTGFYNVKNGETLRAIAQKTLGDAEKYRELMELNGLTNSNIYAGQTLRIPINFGKKFFLYRVNSGDNLWELSQKFLGNGNNYKQIMALNGLTNDMIYPGQILRIPTSS